MVLESVEQVEARAVSPVTEDLSQGLPNNVAVLKVIPTQFDGETCFRLEMHFRGQIRTTSKPADLTNQRRPYLVMADVVASREWVHDSACAVKSYNKLVNWSDTKYTLTKWLTILRQELGHELQLIIWDDTDFEIPWELFRHSMDGKPAWLGTAVQLIRWTTVHEAGRESQFSAELGECGTDGGIVLFEDLELVADRNTSLCRTWPAPPGYEFAETMTQLLDLLEDMTRIVGFVYVRCHGTHGASLEKTSLAEVTLASLGARTLRALQKSNPLIFLNTCNSARAVVDRSLGERANRTFAEVFLRRRARAVIATLAEVPVGHSNALARRLVKEAQSGHVALAERLREHRAKYANSLPSHTANLGETEQDAIKAFLFASMFVYFGHPDTTFRLASHDHEG